MSKKKLITIIIAAAVIGGIGTAFMPKSVINSTKALASKITNSTPSTSSSTTNTSTTDNSVKLVVDVDNSEKLPKNFRTSKDTISAEDAAGIDLTGLSDLNISGGGSMSENGLKAVINATQGYKLVDIDLRQESHGLINGMAISWYGENDGANAGLTRDQIEDDEEDKLEAIEDNDYVKFDVLPNNKSVDVGELTNLTKVETEEDLADDLDVKYIRITNQDHYKPTDENVDRFVDKVKDLSSDKWLHFHCRGGKGRTTTFMSMYDMMKNAKTVSYNDILKRQQLIGGSDLLTGNDEDQADPSNSRAAFLTEFYAYCKDNTDNFKTSFSDYKKAHPEISSAATTNTSTSTTSTAQS